MMLNNGLRCVVFASTLVEMQRDTRVNSGPFLAFLCLVVKKSPTFLVINLCVSQINVTQGLASLCEPAFTIMYSDVHAPFSFEMILKTNFTFLPRSVIVSKVSTF